MAGSTFIQVPPNITDGPTLKRFLDKLVLQLDIAFGNRGNSEFSSYKDLSSFMAEVNEEFTTVSKLDGSRPYTNIVSYDTNKVFTDGKSLISKKYVDDETSVLVHSVTATSPIDSTEGTDPVISISQATVLTDGYLSSTDWTTFNGKQAAYTNLTSIGSLANGAGWLYNDGSGNFVYSTPSGGVTSVSGTSPINSSGGTTPTISIDKADSTHNGYLSSTDWSTFNNKEPAQTKGSITEATSSVLTITNGSSSTVGPNVTIQVKQATNAVSGYLSSTDWNTFNGKQAAYTNLTSIGGLANSSGWLKNNGSGTFSYSTPTATDVGLGNVTNNAQLMAPSYTTNYLAKFSSTTNTLVNSVIYDDGTNVGIGATPYSGVSAARYKLQASNIAFQVGTYGALQSLDANANQISITYNTYFGKAGDGSGSYATRYSSSSKTASQCYYTTGTGWKWDMAPSGTAGDTITMTTVMTLDASGNLIQTVNSTAPTLSTNKTMTFELTSDTQLKIKVRGSDGATRSTSLTLA